LEIVSFLIQNKLQQLEDDLKQLRSVKGNDMEIAVLLEDLDILHSMNVPDGPCILDGHNFGFGHRNGTSLV